jgi:hypothetical protein
MPPAFTSLGDNLGDAMGDSLGNRDDALSEALGASYAIGWRADEYDPGTGPDVASAANQAVLTGYADASQAVEANRPHATTDGGLAAWSMDSIANQHLTSLALSPALNSTGDLITMWFVARASGGTGGGSNNFLLYFFNSGYTENISLRFLLGKIRAAGNTVTRGAIEANVAFTDTTAPHVFRLTIDASNITVAVDGAETSSAGATGGVSPELVNLRLGNDSYPLDYFFHHAVVAVNPTAAQITAAEQAIGDEWGITIS